MTAQGEASPGTFEPIVSGPGYKEMLGDMLARANMFSDLSPEHIATLAKYVRAFRARKDAAIFLEGEHAGFMCIVISGRVRVFRDSGGGRSKTIAEADAGKSLGEMSMIDDMPHSATTVAIEPVTLVTLTRADFTRLVDENPTLATKILWRFARIMSERLRSTSGLPVDSLDLLNGKS